jgi:hypothetical protein
LTEFLARVWDDLIGRTMGPMKFRLVLQPLMACFFAARAGLRQARDGDGRPLLLRAMAFDRDGRRALMRMVWRDIGKVIILALILDAIYQLIVVRMIYPGEAIIVAILLALVPYLLVRMAVSRLFG